jgi:NTP pyrophosphatase (non-canonical NTP hydrolase)
MNDLIRKLRDFAAEREWQQFHSPKNIAMALSVETAEIVEIFQWLTQEQSFNLDEKGREHLAEEIGDVMIYLTNLADKFGIDPLAAAHAKMIKNAEKYPVDKARGLARKYNEL